MAVALGSVKSWSPQVLNTKNFSNYQSSPATRTSHVCLVTVSLSTPNTFTRKNPTFRFGHDSRFPTRASPRGTFRCKSSASDSGTETAGRGEPADEWFSRLPTSNTSLYSHSLPCIEAWLRSIGFCQVSGSPEQWSIERPDWHAELVVDVTDLTIR